MLDAAGIVAPFRCGDSLQRDTATAIRTPRRNYRGYYAGDSVESRRAGHARPCAPDARCTRVVDRSADACFARAKIERDLGSARRLDAVLSARDTSRS